MRRRVLWRLHERGHPRHHVLVLPHGGAEDQVPVEAVHHHGADVTVRHRIRALVLRHLRRALPQNSAVVADVRHD